MNALKHSWTCLLVCSLFVVSQPLPGAAQQNSDASKTRTERDGQHDFDFEIGTWKTHVSRRVHPLTDSTTWVEYDGTSVVRKIWNGRANLLELEVDGPAGHIEGLSLRLYDPQSHQWSLNFANSNGGGLSQPTIGEFKNGRGEFYDQEPLNGRAILVRFVISDITPNSAHFEQAFSDDGGKTWEVNWIATDTRVQGEKGESSGAAGSNSVHDAGFTGHANPGKSFLVDASREYSMTKSWVLALDATYLVTGFNTIDPNSMQNTSAVRLNSGSSEVFALAPAIEYSWKPNLGVLLGTRLIAGRNTTSTMTPAVAINFVR
jgi:hypothetical protein